MHKFLTSDPNFTHPKVLRVPADQLAKPFSIMFLRSHKLPQDWKLDTADPQVLI